MTEFAETVKRRTELIRRIEKNNLTSEELTVELARLKVINYGLRRIMDDDVLQLIFSFQEELNKNLFGMASIDGYYLGKPEESVLSGPKLSIVLQIVCLLTGDDKEDIREIFLNHLHALKPEIQHLSSQYGVDLVISGEFI